MGYFEKKTVSKYWLWWMLGDFDCVGILISKTVTSANAFRMCHLGSKTNILLRSLFPTRFVMYSNVNSCVACIWCYNRVIICSVDVLCHITVQHILACRIMYLSSKLHLSRLSNNNICVLHDFRHVGSMIPHGRTSEPTHSVNTAACLSLRDILTNRDLVRESKHCDAVVMT